MSDIALFKDSYAAPKEVLSDVATIHKFPARERQAIRELLGDTYALMDSALLLVINRLGDLLRRRDSSEFAAEVANLAYAPDWLQLERDVRLCENLYGTGREMTTVLGAVKLEVSVRDPDGIHEVIDHLLQVGEAGVADRISSALAEISQTVDLDEAETKIREAREALKRERDALLDAERETRRLI